MTTDTPAKQPRPVMFAMRAVVAAIIIINALPALLLSFEIIHWTAGQYGAYSGFLNTLLGAVAYLLGIKAEAQVTPVGSPRDNGLVPFVPQANDALED